MAERVVGVFWTTSKDFRYHHRRGRGRPGGSVSWWTLLSSPGGMQDDVSSMLLVSANEMRGGRLR